MSDHKTILFASLLVVAFASPSCQKRQKKQKALPVDDAAVPLKASDSATSIDASSPPVGGPGWALSDSIEARWDPMLDNKDVFKREMAMCSKILYRIARCKESFFRAVQRDQDANDNPYGDITWLREMQSDWLDPVSVREDCKDWRDGDYFKDVNQVIAGHGGEEMKRLYNAALTSCADLGRTFSFQGLLPVEDPMHD
jgi:hypothetical protein